MADQSILITGGSGTFGTAYIRQALADGARRVIAFSRGEHRQAALAEAIQDSRLECWIGDVRDRDRLQWAFDSQPDIVIHAAALKRVEACEQNADEARKTNIDGTSNVVQLAMRANIPKVLVISSDKACSPETTYGTTKAAAEVLAIGQNAWRGHRATRISVVRYGNVLGSQGSFLEQLYRARNTGEPLSVTDLAATRFWWGIEDAVAFVGTVFARMRGAEIWIPKLVSARVDALAQAIAPASPILVTGMRGAEKVHEAMINETEARYAWELPDCYVLLPQQRQWWSPQSPDCAVKVPEGFTYRSDSDPLSVQVVEEPCASPS